MPLPADLSVRALLPGDLGASIELMMRCHATYPEWAPPGWEPPEPHAPDTQVGGQLGHPERWSSGAFDLEGRLVAMCIWEQFKDPTTGETPAGVAHVSAVFVDPGRWRQGIASHLLTEAEQAMLRRGYRLAHLWTPDGSPARRFYEAHGWRHDGRRTWQDRSRLHEIGYEKQLTR